MTDLDAMRAMLASAGLPELSPWQQRTVTVFYGGRWGPAVVDVPYHSGRRSHAEVARMAQRAARNAEAPATMGDGGREAAG